MSLSNNQSALSAKEREATALLYQDGWTIDELRMTMQVDGERIRAALRAEGVYES